MTKNNYLVFIAAVMGCAGPDVGWAPEPLTIADDAGVVQAAGVMTLQSGEEVFGERSVGSPPAMLMSWEAPQAGVFRLGMGQGSVDYRATTVLQLDADEKIAFLLNSEAVMKLQDHSYGYALLHLSEVPKVWFGNTLNEPAELIYQGTNSSPPNTDLLTGVAEGQPLRIMGQGMNDANGTETTHIVGGDLELRGGHGYSGRGLPVHAGDVVVGGGRIGYPASGNVALHEHPNEGGYGDDWDGMRGGVYVHDALNPPSGNPTDGGYLFSDGGALYWRGSAGTVTMIAAP